MLNFKILEIFQSFIRYRNVFIIPTRIYFVADIIISVPRVAIGIFPFRVRFKCVLLGILVFIFAFYTVTKRLMSILYFRWVLCSKPHHSEYAVNRCHSQYFD